MGWLQDAENFPKLKATGLNCIAGFWRPADPNQAKGKGAPEYAEQVRKAGLYFLPPYEPNYAQEMAKLKASDVLLAWMQNDEPDSPVTRADANGVKHKEPRESAAEVMAKYKALKAFDPSRPMLMTVTDFFIHDKNFDNWWTREQQDKVYPEILKAADVVGFDVYPIYGWNQPAKIGWVSQGMRDLRAYAGKGKPLYQWIEVLPGGKFKDKAAPVTGVEIRNEVWQAIINGAVAIGYFTHRFEPEFSEFGVSEENQKAILEINRQITGLTAVLAAADAAAQPKIEIEGGLAAQCLAKDAEGSTVLFAQNYDGSGKSGKGTISVAGLKAGTKVEVVDEGRAITAESGKFSDDFARLAVHIYRLPK
jgi:hypothetical protein